MGLADRDYMRDRKYRGSVRQEIHGFPNTTDHLRKAAVEVAVVAGLTWVAVRYFDARHAEPFPPTGQVRWFVPEPGPSEVAPLTIIAPSDRNLNYAVKLADWRSGKMVALVPIRQGETANLKVPLGEYRISIAEGKNWQGTERLFGRSGEVRDAVAPMHFYSAEGQRHGHTIHLAKRINGNMEMRPASLF